MRAIGLVAITSLILCSKLETARATIITDEIRLLTDLFANRSTVLPVSHTGKPTERTVNVTIGLTLNQVVDVASVVYSISLSYLNRIQIRRFW